MNHHQPDDLRQTALGRLQQQCAEESDRFFRRQPSNPAFCHELFRRAIVDRDQAAWSAVYHQYQPLVLGWVTRHPAFRAESEDAAFFLNRAYERFWVAMTPERFREIHDLAALLRYLQLCVHSVILDDRRRYQSERTTPLDEALYHETPELFANKSDPLADHEAAALWAAIEARLSNQRERRVAYASFFLDLRPREIYAESGELFASVADVYRVKENLIARLRRDQAIRAFFEEHA